MNNLKASLEFSDSSSGALVITEKEITDLPVRGFQAYLELLPGVIVQDGLLHVRSGGAMENSYWINGFNLTNPFNLPGIHVIPEAIRQMRVLPGNFSSNINADGVALIATDLKSGGPGFHFKADVQSDQLAPAGGKFLDTYSYRERIFTAVAGGSLFRRHTFFIAVENHEMGDYRKRRSRGFRFEGLADSNPANSSLYEQPDSVNLSYPEGFTPGNSSRRNAANMFLVFDFRPLTIKLTGLYDWHKFYFTNRPMLSMLNDRRFYTIQNSAFLGADFRYDLSGQSYLNMKIGYYFRRSEKYDDYLGNDWQKWADSAAVVSASDGTAEFRDAWRVQYDYMLYGFSFDRSGAYQDYEKYQHNWLESGLNFTSQIRKHHKIDVGLDMRKFTLRQFSINPFIMSYTDADYLKSGYYPSLNDMPASVFASYIGNNYGYDRTGNEMDNGFDGPKKPLFVDSYLNYRFHWKNLALTTGLQYHYFDTRLRTLIDPANPEIDPETGMIREDQWQEIDPLTSLDGRLSASYLWDRNTLFFLNYGKFTIAPLLGFAYNSFSASVVTGGFYYAAPSFDLQELTRVHSVELGFTRWLGNFGLLRGEIYWKTRNTTEAEYVSSVTRSTASTATAGATDILGFDLLYSCSGWNRFKPTVQYTFLNASKDDFQVSYQHKHQVLANLDYRFSNGDGGVIFENAGMNLLIRYGSGHPFLRYSDMGGQSDPYSAGVVYMLDTRSRDGLDESYTPWTSNVDLRIYKVIKLWRQAKATFFIRVTNLLDTKNVIHVYPATGSAEDDGFISQPEKYEAYVNFYGQVYLDLYKALNIRNGQAYLDLLGMELYGHPRQILLGVTLAY